MAHEQKQALCYRCLRDTLHTRQTLDIPQATYVIAVIVLSVFVLTLPLALIVLLVWAVHGIDRDIRNRRIPFRCQHCGQAEGELTPRQQVAYEQDLAVARTEQRRQQLIDRAHRREIRRGRRVRRWRRIDDLVARLVGRENEILCDVIGGFLRTMVWALPLGAMAAAAIVVWSYYGAR